MKSNEPTPDDRRVYRSLYPDENDPGALRVELSHQIISPLRGVTIIATDHPLIEDREQGVRIILTAAQAGDLVRRLQAVIAEL